ncbi:MAG: methicillin resistance protein [uncultured bacterium (gcode 4)]|uniref:Methicillin resistance protein n=1 Tax=uncultured bacterium (gcode 4) TaxID=1234023 RepID=K2F5P6_9BACT|nr:MAG: methicillin resistance protein [uncultured bacterium (gcode 4)]
MLINTLELISKNDALEKISKEIKKITDKNPYNPIWQTLDWNLMLKEAWYVEKWFFIWIYDEPHNLQNFAIIEKRSIGLWKFAFFILWWPSNDSYLELLEKEIIRLWKVESIIYIQIEPLIYLNFNWFKNFKLKKFIEKYTILIDLEKSLEDILSEMKPKWRYNIKVAEKHWIKIEKSEFSEKNVNIFYDLLSETNKRDKFNINSLSYFKTFLDYIYKNNLGWLYFAKKDEEVIACWIFIISNNTCYYYYWASTSDNNKRKFMASYLIQWEMIKKAKNEWCKFYDFLWIAMPWSSDSSLAWVTDFKLKFSENIKEWPNSQIYINKKIYFYFFLLKNKIKNFLK